MRNKNIKKANGFTIIEVMIVLAIAGLILLIVFLAVPALQRNSRNTERKNDVSSLASAVSEFVDNNNGALPAVAADGTTITSDWKPGYYTSSNVTFNYSATATDGNQPSALDNIIVTDYSTCVSNKSSATGATSRSVAITYFVETGGGKTEQCITAN